MVRFGSSRSANRKSQGKTWRKAVQFANHAVRTVLHKGTVTVGPHALANARTQSERDGSTQLPCGLAAWLDGWMARSQLAERCPRASKTVSAWPAQVISRISPFYLLVRTWPELCLCVARSVSRIRRRRLPVVFCCAVPPIQWKLLSTASTSLSLAFSPPTRS